MTSSEGDTVDAGATPRRVHFRRGAVHAACLAALAAAQLALTYDKLDRPLLDGALHYDFDNAYFTTMARNGTRLEGPRTAFGLTMVSYSTWGVPSGEPTFYTHHPFLMPMLYQRVVAALGDAEWVSRAFSLAIAWVAASGLFTALLLATGSLAASFLGALLLVNIPVLATYQLCPKYETVGIAAGMWLFVLLARYLRAPSRTRLAAVGAAAAVAVLAHWTGLLFAAALCAWLAWARLRTGDARYGRAAVNVGAGTAAGAATVLGVFAWLKGGVARFAADFGGVAVTRSDVSALPPGAWVARQRQYLEMNFGDLLPWAAVVAGVLAVALWTRRRRSPGGGGAAPGAPGLLPALFTGSLATACVWQLAFPQGSYVHVFWQLWFCVPIAVVVAAAVAAVEAAAPRARWVAVAAAALLIAHAHVLSRRAFAELLRLERGVPEEVALLKAVRSERFSRFVFIPVEDTPFNAWFTGPIFEYYSDRPVAALDASGLRLTDKVLLLAHDRQRELVAELEGLTHVRFTHERCAARVCAYDVQAP